MASTDRERRSARSNTRQPATSPSALANDAGIESTHSFDNPYTSANAHIQDPDDPSASRQDFRPASHAGSSTSSGYQIAPRGDYFRSRRVQKGTVERPWLEKKDPREKWVTAFPIIGLITGLAVVGVLVWDGVRSVAVHKYCEVFNDDFSSWNSDVWTKEVEVGGYG